MASLGSRFGFLFFCVPSSSSSSSGRKGGWVIGFCSDAEEDEFGYCNRFSRFHALRSLCLIWRLYILKRERFVLETRKEESKAKGDFTYHCS